MTYIMDYVYGPYMSIDLLIGHSTGCGVRQILYESSKFRFVLVNLDGL